MKQQFCKSVLSKVAGIVAIAATVLGCSGEAGEGTEGQTGDVSEATSSGCTGGIFAKSQCIGVHGTGLNVQYVNSQFYQVGSPNPLCGQHRVWDSKKKFNLYSARQCIRDGSRGAGGGGGAHNFTLNRNLPDGDVVCVEFTGYKMPACETIHK
jgi:hypothetical protein